MDRRSFLRNAAGLFVAAAAAPIVEPARRIWQVGAQLERPAVMTGSAAALYDAWGLLHTDTEWAKAEPFTWAKLQEGIRRLERRSSLPQEPPRYYLTPQEFQQWRELADEQEERTPGTYLRESLAVIRKLGTAPT